MKKIGNIDISFKNYLDGIYYYNLDVQIGDVHRTVTLPRYDTFLGWIEVFGLSPQNEWVVLGNMEDFKKKSTLMIDGRKIEESAEYVSGENTHTIRTVRTMGDVEEKSVWKQNYENAPDSILSEILFDHSDGKYKTEWITSVLPEKVTLTTEESSFVAGIEAKHGVPDLLIKKTFKSSGTLPPIYYFMFPVQELLNLSEASGSVIEIGYLNKNSPHKIDNVHGNWYKRFDFEDKKFYIEETNYTSSDQTTQKGVERIKDTYRKELFVI